MIGAHIFQENPCGLSRGEDEWGQVERLADKRCLRSLEVCSEVNKEEGVSGGEHVCRDPLRNCRAWAEQREVGQNREVRWVQCSPLN